MPLVLVAMTLSTSGAAEPLEVSVTAPRHGAPSPRDATAASWVARGETLREPGNTSADVLEGAPGVQITRSGGAADLSTASLRGASSAQTPVYLAGVRLNDDVTGTADLSTIPLFLIDRVEVYRGNAPGHADRLGLGGAIFFEPRVPARTEGAGGVEVGSFGHLAAWAVGASGSASAGASVAARRVVADGDFRYVDDGGTFFDASDDREVRRTNADHETWDVWSVGRWSLGDRGRIVGVLNVLERHGGVAGSRAVPAVRARTAVSRTLAALSARVPCSRRGCAVDVTTSALAARQNIEDPAYELALLAPAITSEGARASTDVAVTVVAAPGLEVRAGLGRAFERLVLERRARGVTASRRETTRFAASAAIGGDGTVGSALGTVECHGTSPTGSACDVLEPSGRLGAALPLTRDGAGGRVDLLANVGRYARVPTLGETSGISPFVRGNPGLRSEYGVSADAGGRWVHDARNATWALEAFGFARWSSDLVAYRRTSVGAVAPFNVGSARTLGVEAFGSVDALDALSSSTSLTLLDPRDTTEGRRLVNDVLPFQSRLVAAETVEVHTPRSFRVGALERLALGVGVVHRSSRFADPAGLEVLPADTTVDVGLSTRWLDGRLRAAVRADNVLDARRLDVVGLPRPGRTLFATLEGAAW